MQFSPVASSLLRTNILSALFSKALNLFSSLRVTGGVSHLKEKLSFQRHCLRKVQEYALH